MFLLDTPVVLEFRKGKSERIDPGVASWAAATPRQQLFISALSLLELESSVARSGSPALRSWLDDQVMTAFDQRILPIDAAVARKRPSVTLADNRDALLAATALVHGLTLVTRNAAAYRSSRLKLFNPWGYAPESTEDLADWRQVAKASPVWLKNLFLRF
jgi:predicted nucleic acid-binding protein